MTLRLTFAEPEPIKMLPGVEAALKMREKFISEDYKVYLEVGASYNLSNSSFTVARMFITRPGGFFRGFYFYEDGTYFNGSN